MDAGSRGVANLGWMQSAEGGRQAEGQKELWSGAGDSDRSVMISSSSDAGTCSIECSGRSTIIAGDLCGAAKPDPIQRVCPLCGLSERKPSFI